MPQVMRVTRVCASIVRGKDCPTPVRFAPDPPLPATVLFDHPNIADLAGYLLGAILGFEKEEETSSVSTAETNRHAIVEEIEQLSEGDLASLVAAELQDLFPSEVRK